MLFSDAFVLIADGVRPSFKPITRVGVLPVASSRSLDTSLGFQGFPEFRLYFAICVYSCLSTLNTTYLLIPEETLYPIPEASQQSAPFAFKGFIVTATALLLEFTTFCNLLWCPSFGPQNFTTTYPIVRFAG